MKKLRCSTFTLLCLTAIPHQADAAEAGVFRDCPACPEMVMIPPGSFDMGSPGSEAGRFDNEGPVHQVFVAGFALGKSEITRGQFAAFVEETDYDAGGECWTLERGKAIKRSGRNWRNPGYAQDDAHPVACVNWNDAQAYVDWLSKKTGKPYRLPSEAEWEYAARGNTGSARYWGDSPDEACKYANVADVTAKTQILASWTIHNCSDGYAYTAPAVSHEANAFGLHGVIGNLWEWTEDGWHDNYNDAPADGSVWHGGGTKRVLRGGSWVNHPRLARAAVRGAAEPAYRSAGFGFRLASTQPVSGAVASREATGGARGGNSGGRY